MQVKDKYSLKRFVLSARDYVESDYLQTIEDFREENGHWWKENVYLYILDKRGKVYLHPKYQFLENQQNLRLRDQKTGEYIRELIFKAADNERGAFIKYNLEGTPTKIAYVVPFRNRKDDKDMILVGVFSLDDN